MTAQALLTKCAYQKIGQPQRVLHLVLLFHPRPLVVLAVWRLIAVVETQNTCAFQTMDLGLLAV